MIHSVIFQHISPNHPLAGLNVPAASKDEISASLSAMPLGHRLNSTLINQFRLRALVIETLFRLINIRLMYQWTLENLVKVPCSFVFLVYRYKKEQCEFAREHLFFPWAANPFICPTDNH